jgi:hypothetical protein
MAAIPDKEFKSLLLKMISDLKENSNKQINEVNQCNTWTRKPAT